MNRLYRIGIQGLVAATKKSLANRQFSTSHVVSRGTVVGGGVHPGYIKIREQYKRFQVDDGIPIHLKAGFRDRVLYGFTWVIHLIGLAMCAHYSYVSAWPPKPAAIAEPPEESEETQAAKGKCD